MLAIGCIQAQKCHTDTCLVGVATQNAWLARGLVPKEKAARVANYIRRAPRPGQGGPDVPGEASRPDQYRLGRHPGRPHPLHAVARGRPDSQRQAVTTRTGKTFGSCAFSSTAQTMGQSHWRNRISADRSNPPQNGCGLLAAIPAMRQFGSGVTDNQSLCDAAWAHRLSIQLAHGRRHATVSDQS